mmetsp:Transcript_5723/g.14581  ORF Transcript_5723/g.14581 Transcript_5723/m.14581 type:complete len:410 (-) Transcript_5723:364-1593(-)
MGSCRPHGLRMRLAAPGFADRGPAALPKHADRRGVPERPQTRGVKGQEVAARILSPVPRGQVRGHAAVPRDGPPEGRAAQVSVARLARHLRLAPHRKDPALREVLPEAARPQDRRRHREGHRQDIPEERGLHRGAQGAAGHHLAGLRQPLPTGGLLPGHELRRRLPAPGLARGLSRPDGGQAHGGRFLHLPPGDVEVPREPAVLRRPAVAEALHVPVSHAPRAPVSGGPQALRAGGHQSGELRHKVVDDPVHAAPVLCCGDSYMGPDHLRRPPGRRARCAGERQAAESQAPAANGRGPPRSAEPPRRRPPRGRRHCAGGARAEARQPLRPRRGRPAEQAGAGVGSREPERRGRARQGAVRPVRRWRELARLSRTRPGPARGVRGRKGRVRGARRREAGAAQGSGGGGFR